jgi:hypothetical protein
VERALEDLLNRADRFREQAIELSELAKLATSYVVHDRYRKLHNNTDG